MTADMTATHNCEMADKEGGRAWMQAIYNFFSLIQ
jgi:hypothetical protein